MFNSVKKDPSLCRCMCHNEGTHMMHIIACCHKCSDCGKNVTRMDIHKAHCNAKKPFTLIVSAEESIESTSFSEACNLGADLAEGFDVWRGDELWLSCVKDQNNNYEVTFHNIL